jgi:hypothetical protein
MTGAEMPTPSRSLDGPLDRRDGPTGLARLNGWLKPLIVGIATAGVAWGTMRSDLAHMREDVDKKADSAVMAEQYRAVLRELDEIHRLVEPRQAR